MEEMASNAVDSDDDFDWEEVQVPEHHLEITLQTHSKPDKNTNKFVVIHIPNRLQEPFSFWSGRKEYRMKSVSCALTVIRFTPSRLLSMLEYAING